MQCMGDADASGCVAADFGRLDLLTDCTDGCTTELAAFGREGYFWQCDGEYLYDYLNGLMPELAFGAPDIDPEAWCSEVSSRVFAVKDGVVYDSWGGDFDESCDWAYAGVTSDQFVRHGCLPLDYDEGFASVIQTGYLYYTSGDTYMLSERGLFRFQPEAVTDALSDCDAFANDYGYGDAPECPAPTFPALGATPTRAEGFWVMCPSIDNGPNTWPSFDVDACATLTWGEGEWSMDADTELLLVRDDSYIVQARSLFWSGAACSGAVRSLGGDPASVAVITRSQSTLQFEAEQWDVFEQSGETFLKRRTQNSDTSGYVLRKVPLPPEFADDPCDSSVPTLGF